MGAAIAAHLANAGTRVTLLDIVPRELMEKEEKGGLTLKDKVVRNRIVQMGLDAALKSRPASFVTQEHAALVSVGNLEDDFEVIAEADWVIEVIIENLKIKQDLMARIDDMRGERTIVSSNTSGIPIKAIAEGRLDEFKAHFLGTHFFNPPRYLKLFEVIPLVETKAEVLEALSGFAEKRLGKGIVMCKDTPNFIANRIGSVTGAFALDYILEHGYTVPEVDAITGPAMGRPKTATFRLLDLVGIDVANHVRSNLAEAIPHDAAALKVLNSEKANSLTEGLQEKGWLGNKNKTGFYKQVRQNGKKEFLPLNLKTLEHEAPGEKPRFDSIGKARKIDDPVERIKTLIAGDDRAAQLARALTFNGLSYAAQVIPEIADTPDLIDNAVRWGFMHESGPFATWDALGVAGAAEEMQAEGYVVADWVQEMLAAGKPTFYQYDGSRKTAVYDPAKKDYKQFEELPQRVSLQAAKDSGKVISKNTGATLIDLGDGIVNVEFHTKMNALDADIIGMLDETLDKIEDDGDVQGLVVGNEADNFSAGANLMLVLLGAQSEQWDQLIDAVRTLQNLHQRMRYFPKPVVIAPAGLALGGGCEMIMHGSRVVAHSELYTGLVEVGAGVIPAGAGTKEMMRRIINPSMRTENTDALPFLEKMFYQVGQAKVATSAEEARQFRILGEKDRVVMHRDHLLSEAKREALYMAESGYVPPMPEKIYASGRDMLAALRVGIYMFKEGGYISEYDAFVGEKLAYVMTGGELSSPGWVDEQYILDLECETFLSLCGQEKTQQRIAHILNTGKPLRN